MFLNPPKNKPQKNSENDTGGGLQGNPFMISGKSLEDNNDQDKNEEDTSEEEDLLETFDVGGRIEEILDKCPSTDKVRLFIFEWLDTIDENRKLELKNSIYDG